MNWKLWESFSAYLSKMAPVNGYNHLVYKIETQLIQWNRPFARSGHMVRNTLHWGASYVVGLPKQSNSYQSSPTFLVLKVPLRNLCPSVIYFVPCDRIVQRTYYHWRSTRLGRHTKPLVHSTVLHRVQMDWHSWASIQETPLERNATRKSLTKRCESYK